MDGVIDVVGDDYNILFEVQASGEMCVVEATKYQG
jgi:hypothetical protein